ncbi:alpha-amylase family glycosyl hydrolase [Prevotella sp. OH937_COT-195]|uniref:alpha-amylase family glycosyl hydrolase n=1 Tax=Prevotella sp. OH937_COT-195 TaxID=2491051 RepID=UPI000F651F41|nr:alpha-amylase family glycosyl hydrolase [Prevotella sp. OH937_COT-195]RRD02406.1 starch-binding protein [Prevotella sp. OH937_COT-195]
MRRLIQILFLWSLCIPVFAQAEGWPSNYKGVMLQGFYWDSYDDTKWATLTSRSEELSGSFSLIWIPNAGKTSSFYHNPESKSMGYDPCFWLDNNSCFGTEAELRTMISTFHDKGTGIIADVVINHKNGLNSWADFPDENVTGSKTGKTYSITWDNTNFSGICRTDEANRNDNSPVKGKLTGNDDTGDDFDGYRDLDHTNTTVRQNINTYVDFLTDELGFAGFRYDMVKGYGAGYIQIYNNEAKPTYSVGEYWDGNYTNVTNWIKGTGYTSAAFDFPLKDVINNAFGNGNWGALSNKGIAGDPYMSRYAVTFVDNHDTYREASIPLKNNILAANAFILAMPGTPCIFLQHWKDYKTELQKMIAARKEAGITNQSRIVAGYYKDGGYVTIVQGENKKIMVVSGYPQGVDTNGYTQVSVGNNENPNYAYYIETEAQKDITVYVKADQDPLYMYVWGQGGEKLAGEWPGTQLGHKKIVGDTPYYYMTFKTDKLNFIISKGDNATQTGNIENITNDVFYRYNNNNAIDETAANAGKAISGELNPLTFGDDQLTTFFESPVAWNNVSCWAWNTERPDVKYTGNDWPGQPCQYIGKAANGNKIWKWTYDKSQSDLPDKILFNDGQPNTNTKSLEYDMLNGGYYTISETKGTGINTTLLFDREFTADRHSTICLPFSIDVEEILQLDGKAYYMAEKKGDVLIFREATSIEAFKPYIFIANNTGKSLQMFNNKFILSGMPIPEQISNFTFMGTMERKNVVSDNANSYYIYLATDGTFAMANNKEGVNVGAFRCYFSCPTGTAPAKDIEFECTTGISHHTIHTEQNGIIYGISGVPMGKDGDVSRLPKGVYIMNGSKFIIK